MLPVCTPTAHQQIAIHIFLHASVQPVRLNVVLDEEDAAAVEQRAEEAGITRPEWVRRAVSAALCSGVYRLGTLDVPAPCEDVQNIDGLHAQITQLQATIDRLTSGNLTLERDRKEALLRAAECDHLREQIRTLESEKQGALLQAALVEKDRDLHVEVRRQLELRVDDLKSQVSHYEGEVVRLTATLPERAGPSRPWWRFWKK